MSAGLQVMIIFDQAYDITLDGQERMCGICVTDEQRAHSIHATTHQQTHYSLTRAESGHGMRFSVFKKKYKLSFQ